MNSVKIGKMSVARKHAILVITFSALSSFLGCAEQKPTDAASINDKASALSSFSQEITSPVSSFQVRAGSNYAIDIQIKNTGTQPWHAGGEAMSVDVGYRWVDDKGSVLPMEGKRGQLNHSLKPGESDRLKMAIVAPSDPGVYTVWVSMVQEGVTWFYIQGSKPLTLRATVN
jgi:hypothetical protein